MENTTMRSRRLPVIVPLTLLAALVAGCESSGSSSTVVPAAPRADVHSVDWRNASYTVSCPGLGAPSGQQVPVTLANGSGRTAPVNWFGTSVPLDIRLVDVSYGQLTGDGTEDALVHLSCNPDQSNGVADQLQVFGPGSTLLGSPTVRNRYTSDFAPAIASVGVQNGRISGVAHYWTADDPHCCPSVTLPFSFTWNPGTRSFEQTA
jgi:hypothetical protein